MNDLICQDNDSIFFNSFSLDADLLEALDKKGYQACSPIQVKAIPEILAGHDVLAAAQTGTGKTAAFALPILQMLHQDSGRSFTFPRALILVPTRELAVQVTDSFLEYGELLSLKALRVFGGVNVNPQIKNLKKGVDILVATPGRLLDLYRQKALRFDDISILVLDEADRMLDMGFIHDIRKILSKLPKQRQNLLFSATFSPAIRKLAQSFLSRQAKEIQVAKSNSTAKGVEQCVYKVKNEEKSAFLIALIQKYNWYQVLVFTRTKYGADRVARHLNSANIKATSIHGDKRQSARLKALSEFKEGKVQVLVATDIAARGLDISQLPQVINYHLPSVPEDYVHRIGRTGRAGFEGGALSLVSSDENKYLQGIEKLIQTKIPLKILEGFKAGSLLNQKKQKSFNQARRKKNKS